MNVAARLGRSSRPQTFLGRLQTKNEKCALVAILSVTSREPRYRGVSNRRFDHRHRGAGDEGSHKEEKKGRGGDEGTAVFVGAGACGGRGPNELHKNEKKIQEDGDQRLGGGAEDESVPVDVVVFRRGEAFVAPFLSESPVRRQQRLFYPRFHFARGTTFCPLARAAPLRQVRNAEDACQHTPSERHERQEHVGNPLGQSAVPLRE